MIVLKVLQIAMIGYILVLSARILLTWFRGLPPNKATDLLVGITEPYLRLFSRFKFLRPGLFDFRPIAALLVLVFMLDLVNSILFWGRITVGIVLAAVVHASWRGLSVLLVMFLILCIVRLAVLYAGRGTESTLSQALRTMIRPLLERVERLLPGRRQFTELQLLIIRALFLFVLRLLGGYLIRYLVRFFEALPF